MCLKSIILIYNIIDYMKTKDFKELYDFGKKSELESQEDIENFFCCKLKLNDDRYSHFDYYNDDIMVELKTRPNTRFENDEFIHTTMDGREVNFETLYFDSPKMAYAFQYNKRLPPDKIKRFYIVWKLKDNKYFYWMMNWKQQEYFISSNMNNYNNGRVNVYKDFMGCF